MANCLKRIGCDCKAFSCFQFFSLQILVCSQLEKEEEERKRGRREGGKKDRNKRRREKKGGGTVHKIQARQLLPGNNLTPALEERER